MLAKVREIWIEEPDLRLLQLLLNCMPRNRQAPAIYMYEDRDLYKALDKYKTLRSSGD